MLPHEKLDTLYYRIVEMQERIDRAYHLFGGIPVVIRAMAAYNALYFYYELNYMLWECGVEMVD